VKCTADGWHGTGPLCGLQPSDGTEGQYNSLAHRGPPRCVRATLTSTWKVPRSPAPAGWAVAGRDNFPQGDGPCRPSSCRRGIAGSVLPSSPCARPIETPCLRVRLASGALSRSESGQASALTPTWSSRLVAFACQSRASLAERQARHRVRGYTAGTRPWHRRTVRRWNFRRKTNRHPRNCNSTSDQNSYSDRRNRRTVLVWGRSKRPRARSNQATGQEMEGRISSWQCSTWRPSRDNRPPSQV
jgi:hypothetical protein